MTCFYEESKLDKLKKYSVFLQVVGASDRAQNFQLHPLIIALAIFIIFSMVFSTHLNYPYFKIPISQRVRINSLRTTTKIQTMVNGTSSKLRFVKNLIRHLNFPLDVLEDSNRAIFEDDLNAASIYLF